MDESARNGQVLGGALALLGLGVTVLLFGDGLGWAGLVPLLPEVGGARTSPVPYGFGILLLAGGTLAAVRLAGRRAGGRLVLFGRVWVGMVVMWSVALCLVAVMVAGTDDIITPSVDAALLAPLGGAVSGAFHGALLGWLVALPTLLQRRPEPVQRGVWRSDPYLILSAVVWLPAIALGAGAQFLSWDLIPGACPSLCVSERDWFLSQMMALMVGVPPMWWLQVGALSLLRRRTTGFSTWPVSGQVIIVLVAGVPVAATILTVIFEI